MSKQLFNELMGSIVFTPDEEFIKKMNVQKNDEKIKNDIPIYKEPEGDASY